MAKPILGIPVFRGRAARWLEEYMNRKITPAEIEFRQKQIEEDKELLSHIVPLSTLKRL